MLTLDNNDVASITVSDNVSPVTKNLEILWYQQFCQQNVPEPAEVSVPENRSTAC
jgi:hypothetical protein